MQSKLIPNIKAPTITPRPYQVAAFDAIYNDWNSGIQRTAVQCPTAWGKTILFSMIAKFAAEQGKKVVIFAHRDDLIQQAVAKFESVAGDQFNVGVVKAARNEIKGNQIVVASIQTAVRENRLVDLVKAKFDIAIVDEGHHSASDGYQKVLESLGCFTEGGPLLLGVSATLRREDGKVLGDIYQNICYQDDILDMIKGGYLKDVQCIAIKVAANLDAVSTVAGDFSADQLDEALDKANTPYHVVQGWLEHAKGRKTVVFTTTVKAAYKTAAEFVKNGVPAEAIDGTDSPMARAEKQGRFLRGETLVLCNCALLTEGWDAPDIDVVVMACPTKSTTKFIQCLGRGLRKYPGKEVCLLLDVCGVVLGKRHKIVSAASLFDVEGEFVERADTIAQAVALKDQFLAEEEERKAGFRIAVPVDMFPVQTGFHWLQGTDGSFILSTGTGSIKVHKAVVLTKTNGEENDVSDLYSVVLTKNNPATRTREAIALATNTTLELAQGISEDYIRNTRSTHLADRNAGWRKDPISTAQKATLRNLGFTDGLDSLTKGEASDHIFIAKDTQATASEALGTPIPAEKATNKQMWYLRSQGHRPNANLTKHEATTWIRQIRENEGQQ